MQWSNITQIIEVLVCNSHELYSSLCKIPNVLVWYFQIKSTLHWLSFKSVLTFVYFYIFVTLRLPSKGLRIQGRKKHTKARICVFCSTQHSHWVYVFYSLDMFKYVYTFVMLSIPFFPLNSQLTWILTNQGRVSSIDVADTTNLVSL